MASHDKLNHLPRRDHRRSPGGVPSLVHLCQAILRANIHALTDIGDIPFELIQPVLIRCSAEQLLSLETINISLRSETQDLWKALVVQEYPRVAAEHRTTEQCEPSWRRIYRVSFYLLYPKKKRKMYTM
ncbi:RNA polymerase II transcription factor SIII subunit A-domain-containing protein [Syncephalis plumigaleata]|nr:RNA polymerase II transcription factor SIII subunit A-domain-containing protein [Syncephalis plumigaleata]